MQCAGEDHSPTMRFQCATCGEEHDLAELSLGSDAPAQWDFIGEEERGDSLLSSDQCVIRTKDETSFFLRACLDIPIQGTEDFFSWGVWVSLSEKSFDGVHDSWRDERRAELGPFFGWLCTAIPGYPDTMFLKTSVQLRPIGLRPLVELEPTEHALAVHQREGIGATELRELVGPLLHDPESEEQ